ncbi:hypothetical protein HDU97_009223 [Phlyctochytrium planicorne]|nr:hypothetical protein HDU97_009223 [Phlyctochytrium planicorne]
MAFDNKFVLYGTPIILILSLIFAIVATSQYWFVTDYEAVTYYFGPFLYKGCSGSFCQTIDIDAGFLRCNSQYEEVKSACAQFNALRGLTVVSDIVLFIAFAALAAVVVKGKDLPKVVAFVPMGVAFVATVLLFAAMCIGASFKDAKIFALQGVSWKLGLGFFMDILGWITSGVAIGGAFLIFQANR